MKKKDIELAEEIKGFIDRNLGKEILIKDLCSEFGINKNKLQARFKSLFGQTIHCYILQQKMEQAAKKLKTTDDPVKAIAVEFGYSSSNFNPKFKKQFGCSPEQFRKKEKVYQ